MFTNKEMLQIAMEQSAWDLGAEAADFCKGENVVVNLELGPHAKKNIEKPLSGNLVSYGSNIVAGVQEDNRQAITEYINRFEWFHCFESPNMLWLEKRLEPLGQKLCFMSEYFLPDMTKLTRLECGYEIRVLEKKDFENLYLPEWDNALCEKRKELDCLGVGAYDGDKLVGFAACSADAEKMWQIGVDVLPEYRRNGIASAVTTNLAMEILDRGKVPFYCCVWSNIRSARNAIKSGFVPSWVELAIKPSDFVDGVNKEN